MATTTYTLSMLLLNVCFLLFDIINAHILVYRRINNQLIEEYDDMPAQFGGSIPANGLKVFGIGAEEDKYACHSINPPPKSKRNFPSNAKFAAIIERGGNECTFERKVRYAQAANFDAAIIYNNDSDDLEHMSALNSSGIRIPSVFVGHTTGISLQSHPLGEIVLVINDELPFNINTQLILPFSILIGLCFLIMIFYMIYKCIREERRLRRYRLPKRMLKKLPILKYTKNSDLAYDTCVICLDEFVEGDKLRVLPCKHPYHSDCIDTWLTENKRDCPICKRKVFTKGEARSPRNRQSSLDSVTDTDDDTTPLLQQSSNMVRTHAISNGNNSVTTRHGTFRRGGDSVGGDGGGGGDHTTDDEMLIPSARRINPFDRTPNLPPHLAAQLNPNITRRSIWSWPILRLLRRSHSLSIAAPPYPEDILNDVVAAHVDAFVTNTVAVDSLIGPVIAASGLSSNNILNPNLSGSFKDDAIIDGQTINEEEEDECIYEPATTPTICLHPQTSINSTETDSVFIQTPTQGGIAVAALPSSDHSNAVQQSRPRDTYEYYV
ncbi:E3 ubiquitin-protein ligase RNF13 isoform X2 [Glossina fuscipes]|uniref:RING-type E3 ubiquitin transferase n=1 Tax=Glossina fuscipes TaxID=7396 RepID=A0A9C5ZDX0_9MUSC|nr:E3 ubiquitin-protein ligase RNF13 isoform X2 [Glossina fuscipes]